MSGQEEWGPVREMAQVEGWITQLEGELAAWRERREELRSILAGPRVTVVVTVVSWGEPSEVEYDDLAEAVLGTEGMVGTGLYAVRSVSVGGAVLSDAEYRSVLVEATA